MQNEKNEDLVEISGIVDSVIYQNEENGYTVCEIDTGNGDPVTLVGEMPFLSEGETVRAMGKWSIHPTFGKQFKAEYYEKELPATESSILRYLSSRTVKGIGPALALRIVEKFGIETFDVIENHPDWLSELPGISMKKAQAISDDFKAQFGLRTVMMFCREFFGPQTAVKIYKRWGGGAVDVIKKDPYVLCDEITGVGFEKADAVAKSLGAENYRHERLLAGIKYILSYNANTNGHVFIPQDKLVESAMQMLSVGDAEVEEAVTELDLTGGIVRKNYSGRVCVYLTRFYESEKYICEKLYLLDRACPVINVSDAGRIIQRIEMEFGVEYATLQKRAILDALGSGVMILTGGPGTGKTTVVRAIIRIFEDMGYEVALAAPTGRAAKRLSESTLHEAKTIHRLLEMDFSDGERSVFRRNEGCLLDENVIIVDETSMVDTLLFSSLLKAIKPGARLILIGDADQLPSVGAGNVLNDLISSDCFSTVELKDVFRQAESSRIVTNAHLINSGEYPVASGRDGDFFFMPRDTDEAVARTVTELVSSRLPKTYGPGVINDIQVITPSRKGAAGTEVLNSTLQNALNPPSPDKKERKVRESVFRVGDRVMQIKNNYDLEWESGTKTGVGVFNGDIGFIEDIDPRNEQMTVIFDDDREVKYDFSLLDELEHAYAVTVHKSQGSEYPIVIIPMYNFNIRLMTRNLLYTAVTRAQKMVILVGREDVVKRMVDTNRPTKRYTGLKYAIENKRDA